MIFEKAGVPKEGLLPSLLGNTTPGKPPTTPSPGIAIDPLSKVSSILRPSLKDHHSQYYRHRDNHHQVSPPQSLPTITITVIIPDGN
jgi:hypothetical protein